jgi:hypothetical protein
MTIPTILINFNFLNYKIWKFDANIFKYCNTAISIFQLIADGAGCPFSRGFMHVLPLPILLDIFVNRDQL